MLRAVGAVVAGLAAAILLIAGIDLVAHLLYAPVQPIDPNDRAAVEGFIANLPAGAFAIILAGWGIGTFAGAWIAARIGRSAVYGFVAGAVLLAATVANLFMVPHPGWMWAAGIVIVVVTAFIAVRSAIPARKSAT